MNGDDNSNSVKNNNNNRLPILIVPGFMSSGLYIKESTTKPDWEGERVWINLTALGFQAAHFSRKHDVDVSQAQAMDDDSTTENEEDDDEHELDVGLDDENEGYQLVEFNDEQRKVGETKPSSVKQVSINAPNDSANSDKILLNTWLHHMALCENMISERKGIKVRNIGGLAGVDYLSPGVMTSLVSYVFGPVIIALEKAGFEAGKSLDAAPYDWRLSPCNLETRDQYFTRTLAQIEEMYTNNGNTPIVMVCHSMGCRMGHYLLNFAKSTKGREWIDKHIHTYCPIGGPHLGAPKALRSFVSGDKMGLDTFLSDSEALILGRSLGSGVLLMPAELPSTSPPTAILYSDWALEVTLMSAIDTDVFLSNREDGHFPTRMKMMATFCGKSLSTPMTRIDSRHLITFGETFSFRTVRELGDKANLTLMLCEPGLRRAMKSKSKMRTWHLCCRENFFARWRIIGADGEEKYKWGRPPKDNCFLFWLNILTFWWLLWPLMRYGLEIGFKLAFGPVYCVLWCFFEGTVLSANEVAQVSGTSSVTAFARIKNIREIVLERGSSEDGHEVELDVDLVSTSDNRRIFGCCYEKRKAPVKVKLKWISPKSLAHPRKTVPHLICQPTTMKLPVLGKHIKSKRKEMKSKYMARSGYDLLEAEGLGERIFGHMDKAYKKDPLGPRELSATEAPPVSRVKAIYGINLATEVSAVYRRKQTMVLGVGTKEVNTFHLDKTALLEEEKPGFELKGGVIYETTNDDRPSGDGTVPYWSLNFAKNWKKDCEVIIDELDGADHREILADKRLHKLLIDYCSPKQ